MKIRHRDLESVRSDPTRFHRLRGGGPPYGPATVLYQSIMYLHNNRDDIAEARDHFRRVCASNGFPPEKSKLYEDRLNRYYEAYMATDGRVACVGLNLNYRSAGGNYLAGQIHRVDLVREPPPCYRALIIASEAFPWANELRWPMIQLAVSVSLRCAVGEVSVGAYFHDTGQHELTTYSQEQIGVAAREFDQLCAHVSAMLSSADSSL